jgi:hypothetical protein
MTMKTDCEVTALAEYMDKRLGESRNGARRGKHRVAFLALRPVIEGVLARGYTMKGTWAALREQGRLSMSYQAFRNHCRSAALVTSTSGAAAPRLAGPTPARPATVVQPESTERRFRHERFPRKKDIYG